MASRCARVLQMARLAQRCNAISTSSFRSSIAARPMKPSNTYIYPMSRHFATIQSLREEMRSASEIVEELTELYDAAQEEFQLAAEETEANTVYAEDDRAAARELVDKLKETYSLVVEDESIAQNIRDEVTRRAGQRVREIDNAMQALEQKAMEHD